MQGVLDPIVISNLSALISTRARGGAASAHHRFLRELPDAFGVDRVGLYLFDNSDSPSDVFTSFAGRSSDLFLREYEQLRSKDPVFRYLRKHNGAMDGSTLLGREGWKSNRLCQWLQKWRLGHTLQGAIRADGRLLATLNLARACGKEAFRGDEIGAVYHLCQELASRFAAFDATTVLPPSIPDALTHCNLRVVTNAAGDIEPASLLDSRSAALYESYAGPIRVNIRSLNDASGPVVQLPVYAKGSGQPCALLVTILLPGDERTYVSSLVPVPSADDGGSPSEYLDELPPRTQKVAELLLKGYSNKLIAKELLVSENTIKDHVKRIFDFYGINSRSQLANLIG